MGGVPITGRFSYKQEVVVCKPLNAAIRPRLSRPCPRGRRPCLHTRGAPGASLSRAPRSFQHVLSAALFCKTGALPAPARASKGVLFKEEMTRKGGSMVVYNPVNVVPGHDLVGACDFYRPYCVLLISRVFVQKCHPVAMQNFHCMWYSCSWSCTAVCPCQVRILARVVDKQLHHSFIKCCPVHGLFSSPGSHPPQPSPHPTTSARGMCSLKMQDDSGPAGNAKRVGASIDADGETFSVLCSPLLAMWVYACVVRMFLHWCVCKRSMCRSLHPRFAQLHEADVCKGFVNMSRIIEDVCTAIYWWYVSSQHCTLCLMQRNKPSVFNVPVSVGAEPLL